MLVEVAAPRGYILSVNADNAITVKPGQTTTADNAEIPNAQGDDPGLPLTAAAGTLLLAGIVVGAITLALVLMWIARRRELLTT